MRVERYESWSGLLSGSSYAAAGLDDWLEGCRRGMLLAPRGAGRSFGDAAFGVPGGMTCSAPSGGPTELVVPDRIVYAAAGETVGAVHRFLEGTAFEFPVYGGTQWASVGGAVAGDIHGKNHRAEGSFGCHVRTIDLVVASGATIRCSRACKPDLFHATLGGMGLTGLILKVGLDVRPRATSGLVVRRRQIGGLDDVWHSFSSGAGGAGNFATFFDLAQRGARGLIFEAEHSSLPPPPPRPPRRIGLPRMPLLTPAVIRAAGDMVLAATRRPREAVIHRLDFHYSGLHEHFYGWNRLFGRKGMVEYQFVAPQQVFPALVDTFVALARGGRAPMLAAVIKPMGMARSGGVLSFPMAGATINFQTPWSPMALDWLRRGTEAVIALGGRVNLTKDCCIQPDQFARMYPALERWRLIAKAHDPDSRIMTALARRLRVKPYV